jgi:hypothetical protein
MTPHEDYALDKVIQKASRVHKLIGVDRETFLKINQISAQLNLTYMDTIRFLALCSGLDFNSDLRKDLKVIQIMHQLGKVIPR